MLKFASAFALCFSLLAFTTSPGGAGSGGVPREPDYIYGELQREGVVLAGWIQIGESHNMVVEPNTLYLQEKKLSYTYTDIDGGEITVTVTYTGSADKAATKLREAVSAMKLVFPSGQAR